MIKKINATARLPKRDEIKKKTIGKLKEVPFRKMAPNIVTLMALCSGITTIRFAIMGKWTFAILCIFG